MPRQAGHNTRPQARLPPSFAGDECMDDLTTECNSDMQAICGSLMYLAYSLPCYPWLFVRPGTGRPLIALSVGINKYLYCTNELKILTCHCQFKKYPNFYTQRVSLFNPSNAKDTFVQSTRTQRFLKPI